MNLFDQTNTESTITILDTGDQNSPPKVDTIVKRQPRDQAWLEDQLLLIWRNHFADVKKLNTVTIKWGRISRTRLGTITAKGGFNPHDKPEVSEIRINSLLQHETIPQSVIWQTIAHELAHYTHGFCSPHPKKYDHPHRGNVIQKELYDREMHDVYNNAHVWIKDNWHTHVASVAHTSPLLKRRKRRTYGKRKSVSLLSHFGKAITRRRRLGR
jgi:hypothetical protein